MVLKQKGKIHVKRSILTKREHEIFTLLVQGLSTKEISKKIKISEKTVRNHISNTMQKLEVKGRANAVVELLKLGEISF
jgi:LuxR family transcriptional regulator of spore coat protein